MPEVQKAVDKGVAYLRKVPKGHLGHIALTGLTLLECGPAGGRSRRASPGQRHSHQIGLFDRDLHGRARHSVPGSAVQGQNAARRRPQAHRNPGPALIAAQGQSGLWGYQAPTLAKAAPSLPPPQPPPPLETTRPRKRPRKKRKYRVPHAEIRCRRERIHGSPGKNTRQPRRRSETAGETPGRSAFRLLQTRRARAATDAVPTRSLPAWLLWAARQGC